MYSYSGQGTEPEPRNWMEHKTIRVSIPGTCLLVREMHGNCWAKNPYTACIVVSSVKEINNVISWRVSGEGSILGKVVKENPSEEETFQLTHDRWEGVSHIKLWEEETQPRGPEASKNPIDPRNWRKWAGPGSAALISQLAECRVLTEVQWEIIKRF